MNYEPLNNFKKIYHWLRHPGDTLSQRVVHGGVWVFALRIVNRGFGLIRTIILARLLAPNDFGLFGIAMLALSTLQSFSQTGFNAALIQKKEDTEPYLDTAWTVQIIRGTLLALILVAGAPLVGAFFEEPRAVLLVRVLAVSVFLRSLKNIGIIYFQKELEFHKQFVYQLSGTLADLAVAIPAAFIFRNVWALIYGLLAGNLVRLILSYMVHKYKPSFNLKLEKNRELFNFGKWIFASSITNFLNQQGDDILVGKVLNVTSLGLYQMAYRISNIVATEITHVISQVTFPAYSKLQDKTSNLRHAFLSTIKIVSLFSIPLAGGIFILAPEFTTVVLGEKWMPMVPALQLFCITGGVRSISANFGPLLKAAGRPDLQTKVSFFNLIIMGCTIYPLTVHLGLVGAAWSRLITLITLLWITRRILIIIESNYKKMAITFLPTLIASLIMVAAILFFKNILSSNILNLFFLVLIGGFIYLGTLALLDVWFDLNIWALLTWLLKKVKQK